MSQKKKYYDLQEEGAKILRIFAMQIVGSEYDFRQLLQEKLGRPDYSIRRYLKMLPRELLLDNFGSLECALKTILDNCSNEQVMNGIDPEELMNQLRDLNKTAIQRYVK